MEKHSHLNTQRMNEADSWLTELHILELTTGDTFAWPQLRAYQDEWVSRYQLIDRTFDLNEFNELPRKILCGATSIRGMSSEPNQDVFDSPSTTYAAISVLPLGFRVEALFAAFAQGKHSLVHMLACDLIQGNEFDKVASERLNMLLIEMVVYSLKQIEHRGFLDDPSVLSNKLGRFLWAPKIRPLMKLDTTSVAKALGCYHCFKGDLDKATSYMEHAHELDGFKSTLFHPIKTVINIRKLETLASDSQSRREILDWFDEQVLLTPFFRHAGADDRVLLVSGDEGYFDLFGENFAEVVGLSNPGALIHFHLVNFPDDRDMETLFENWEQRYSVRINYTLENNKMLSADPAMLRGACANTRFSSLPVYLEQYAGVVVCDIDGWIDRQLSHFIDHNKADVVVRSGVLSKFKGGWRLPWASIGVSPMSYMATAPAKKAAELVAFYIKYLNWRTKEEKGKKRDLFWADQSATFLVLAHLWEKREVSLGFAERGFGQAAVDKTEDSATSKRKGTREIIEKLKRETK